jgi:large subunit ribosomal protein L29
MRLKAKQLKEMTKEELDHKYREMQKQLFNLQCQMPNQEIKNPLQKRLLRRDIARILTVLKEKK